MTLTETGIPISHFQKAWTSPYPTEWKFWKPVGDQQLGPESNRKYPGATLDAHLEPEQPFKDIINWDRHAAALGIFPKSFALFVKSITKSKKPTNKIICSISDLMRTYSYKLFKTYWSLQRASSKNDTMVLSEQPLETETLSQDLPYLCYQTDSDDETPN
eukprot:3198061-Pyramimonas_sp.AAC.1